MKNILLFCVLIIILLTNCHKTTNKPLPLSNRSLRTIVADKYSDNSIIIGGTIASREFGTNTSLILDREFSYVTPENDFKQTIVHPDPLTWDWLRSDAWIQHIADNNQILRMHCPIGPQSSDWARDDNRTA